MADEQYEVIIRTSDTVAKRLLAAGDYAIGKSSLCALAVDDPSLAEEHASLRLHRDRVELTPSAPGSEIIVNNAAERTGGELPLPARFQIGATSVEIRSVDSSRTPTEPADAAFTAEHYEVHGEIAVGGMGRVLDAEDLKLGRTVAMKVLREDDGGNLDIRMRFTQEAEILGWLEHPNIVPIHDFGNDAQGRPYYTMKRVQGETLQSVLNKLKAGDDDAVRRWPLNKLLNVFLKVCDAMAFAHSKGVIHRDLKPENVMVGDFGEVLVMDWGLARLTAGDAEDDPALGRCEESTDAGEAFGLTLDGSVVGTPQFMPPEQARGDLSATDSRSDIYALGAILYSILTLDAPVRGDTVQQVIESVIAGEIVSPLEQRTHALAHCPRDRAPESLAAVATKALQRQPDDRYAQVSDLAADVQAYLGGFATSAESVSTGKRLALWIGRNRILSSAAAIIVILSCLFVYRLVLSEREARASEALARQRGKEARENELAAKAQQQLAEQNAQQAQIQRAAAEASARDANAARLEANLTAADSYLNLGLIEMEKGRHSLAQLWFTHAAELSASDPARREANRMRAYLCGLQPGALVRHVPGLLLHHDLGDHPVRLLPHPNQPYLIVDHVRDDCRVVDWDREYHLHPGNDTNQLWTAAAFHPDGKRFAGSWRDSRVELRTLDGNRVTHEIELPEAEASVRALAFDPAGERLFIGATRARLYDLQRGRFIDNGFEHESVPVTAVFHPDGDKLLTLTQQGQVRLLRAGMNGLAPKPLWGPVRGKRSINYTVLEPTFIKQGKEFVIAEYEAPLQTLAVFYDTDTGRPLQRFEMGQKGPATVTPDGKQVAGRMGLLDVESGERLSTDSMQIADFAPDSDWLVGIKEGDTRLFSARDGSELAILKYQHQHGRHLAVTADMTAVLEHDFSSSFKAWRLQGYPWLLTVPIEPNGGGATGGAFNPDGEYFLLNGDARLTGSPLLATRVYHATNADPAGPWIEPGGVILDGAFSPDSKWIGLLVTKGKERSAESMFRPDGESGNLQFWNWRRGERVSPVIAMPSEPRSLAFHPDGQRAAVVCGGGEILMVDLETWNAALLFEEDVKNAAYSAQRASPGRLAFSDDGQTLVVWGLSHLLHLWDVEAARPRVPPIRFRRYICHDVSLHGDIFSATSWNGGGTGSGLRRLATGELIKSPVNRGLGSWGAKFSRDRKLLLTATTRGSTIDLWNLETGQRHVSQWRAEGPAAFVPDTPAILSVGQPGQVWLWDRNSGKPLGPSIRVPDSRHLGRRLEVSPNGRSALFVGTGLHWLDLSPLHQSPDLGLNDRDLRTLAELNSARRLVDGGFTKLSVRAHWPNFRRRHPELFPLKPPVAQRIQWHRQRLDEERVRSNDSASAYHRQMIEALQLSAPATPQ